MVLVGGITLAASLAILAFCSRTDPAMEAARESRGPHGFFACPEGTRIELDVRRGKAAPFAVTAVVAKFQS